MAIAFVQATNIIATSGGGSLVFPSNVTAGNCIILVAVWNKNDGPVPPVPTAPGYDFSTPLGIFNPVPGTIAVDSAIIAAKVPTTGALTITCPASVRGTLVALEYSGVEPSLDQSAAQGSFDPTGIETAGPTGTTALPNELILSVGASFGGSDFTGDGTYTSRLNAANGSDLNGFLLIQDQFSSSAGTFSANVNFTGVSAIFGVSVLWTLRPIPVVPAFVQSTTGFDNATHTPQPMPSNVTKNNSLIGITIYDFNDAGQYTGVFSDSQGNPYSDLYNPTTAIPGSTLVGIKIQIAKVSASGACNVSISNPQGVRGLWFVMEYSGVASATVLDQSATFGTSSTGAQTAGPITTTAAEELLLAVVGMLGGFSGTASTPAGYTNRVNNTISEVGQTQGIVDDQAVNVAGAYSFTTTLGGSQGFYAGVLLSLFKAPPTHAISGTISGPGGAGATVSYSGQASGQVTADGSGNYTIPNLFDGAYTITPSNTGFVFTPTSQNETLAGADITGVNFSSGVAVYSVPDCRDYATFPNQFRTVQGTKIYDVQTSSNSSVPGVDSRVAGAPVDSRAAGGPQNSRAGGTFGPGE